LDETGTKYGTDSINESWFQIGSFGGGGGGNAKGKKKPEGGKKKGKRGEKKVFEKKSKAMNE